MWVYLWPAATRFRLQRLYELRSRGWRVSLAWAKAPPKAGATAWETAVASSQFAGRWGPGACQRSREPRGMSFWQKLIKPFGHATQRTQSHVNPIELAHACFDQKDTKPWEGFGRWPQHTPHTPLCARVCRSVCPQVPKIAEHSYKLKECVKDGGFKQAWDGASRG